MKVQMEAAYESYVFMAKPADRLEWNHEDHMSVMRELMERLPNTVIWEATLRRTTGSREKKPIWTSS